MQGVALMMIRVWVKAQPSARIWTQVVAIRPTTSQETL
jgi:hypothetical protein